MLVKDVMERVRNIAGDTTSLQFTDDMLADWINDGVRQCAVDNNLLQKRGTINTVVGTDSYALPVDILKLHTVRYDGVKLRVMTLQEFDALSQDVTERGTPSVVYIWAGNLKFWPVPNAVKVITIDYTSQPTDVNTGSVGYGDLELSLPNTYHARIVDYCLAQVAQQDGDLNLYSVKMQEFITGVQNLKDQNEWEQDLYPSISVSSADMGDYYYG